MKKVFFVLAVLVLTSCGLFAQTNVSGLISGNTSWTASGSPYIVTGNILVNAGVTLTIAPGVSVRFNHGLSMQIDGTLLARGTSGSVITFTSNTADTAGAWGYIYFSDSSVDAVFENNVNGNYLSGCILEYCAVQYAGGTNVTDNGAVRMGNAHPFINHCSVRHNAASGIRAYYLTASLRISNSFVGENVSADDGGGIYVYNDPYALTGDVVLSHNTVSNNHATGAGGGIFISVGNYRTIEVLNNTISNNTAANGGGICNAYHGNAVISDNVIKNNTASGGQLGGGGIFNNNYTTVTISDNIIVSNTASGDQFGAGGITNFAQSTATIANNVIADNCNANSGGGIYSWNAVTNVYHNQIVSNTASDAAGIYFYDNDYSSIDSNTIVGNTNSDANNTFNRSIDLSSDHSPIRGNNICGNSCFYELYNDNAQGTPNLIATGNWWGTTHDADIQTTIYDWFDDNNLGIVNFSPYLTSPDTAAPVAPPVHVVKTNLGGGQVRLTWNHNGEANLAGYRVYHGGFNGYSFTTGINAGSDTSYVLTGVTFADTIGVTAYNRTYGATIENDSTIVNDNMTRGNESWFSFAADTATTGVAQTTNGIPRVYALGQNYPNPFNPTTTIRYELSRSSFVTLTVFNTLGQVVSQLVNQQQSAGSYQVSFNGNGHASGVYFYRMQAGDYTATRKLVLLR